MKLGRRIRKSIRSKIWNYNHSGIYFVTICCNERINYFGEIKNEIVQLNEAGKMVDEEWINLKNRFSKIKLVNHVVMPNHFHALFNLEYTREDDYSLGEVIGAFKSITTFQYTKGVKENGWVPFNKKLYQRNYHEHVIQTKETLQKIFEYIEDNPKNWKEDSLME